MDIDVNDLMARARAGDVRAIATVGRHLLHGPDPLRGVAVLRDAMARGDGEAPTLLANLAAHGVLEPRNPAKALDLLRLGAERGWLAAQEQLRFLAGAESTDWAALRRQIDLAGWTNARPRRRISETPLACVIEGFAKPSECDRLIGHARNRLKPALIHAASAEQHAWEGRTNTEADLSVDACDVAISVLLDRVAAAAGVTRAFCEVAKVLHYEPHQEFRLHGDFYETNTAPLREEIARHGQRIMTFLLYLNDDYEGGETDFPKAGLRHRGRKGDVLIFANVDSAGAPDMATLHAGLPPTSGEKWVLSQWIRGKAINGFMTPGAENERLEPQWRERL